MKPSIPQISSLTPLRGIAALMVAVFHFNEVVALFIYKEQTWLLAKGYLMVDLFFILSGFIMVHVYGQTFSQQLHKQTFLKYIGARFARIYPLHLFTLVLLICLYYGSGQSSTQINNPWAIPSHLLLIHSFGIHEIFTWNVPSWSISAEWWAYLVFPLLMWLLGKKEKLTLIVMLITTTFLYVSIQYYLPRTNFFEPGSPAPQNLDVTYDYGFLRGLAGFMLGMVMYYGYKNKFVSAFIGHDYTTLFFLVLGIALFHFGVNDLFIIPTFAGIVLSMARNKGLVEKAFNIRPLQFLGEISYSIYMMHMFLVFFVGFPLVFALGYEVTGNGAVPVDSTTGLLMCIIYLLVTIAVSTITYQYVEKPSRKWLNQKFGS